VRGTGTVFGRRVCYSSQEGLCKKRWRIETFTQTIPALIMLYNRFVCLLARLELIMLSNLPVWW
jgi:hypothetical protein